MKNKKSIKKLGGENNSNLNHIQDFSNYLTGDVEYETEYNCEEAGCHDEGICRCGEIHNSHFKEINFEQVFKEFYRFYKTQFLKSPNENVFFPYCLHRILTKFKIYEPQSWEIDVVSGYYGQEIGNVRPNNINEIHSCLDKLSNLKDQEFIPFVLKLEYGHVLPRLTDSKWSIEKVSSEKLNCANETYRKKVGAGVYVENYPKNLPIGVYEKRGDSYSLVDGYHRYVDLVMGKKRDFDIVVASHGD